jgi:phosphate transport system protein
VACWIVVAISTSAHSSRDFETELRELQSQLLAMGARCERVVGLAFEAFVQEDSEAVAQVEELDARIDRDEIQIHSLILRILALRQPVADDLRFLAMALRLITDLERIGDEAINITERIFKGDGAWKGLVGSELATMAADARDMLHEALDAFVRWDADAAERILGADAAVDGRCASIISAMTAHMSTHPGDVRSGLRVIRVAKYLERIADHATNVAEQVIFMVRGEDVRHGQWQRR